MPIRRKAVIGVVASHACIRVDKEALPLIEAGYEVHCISRKPPAWVNYYTTFTQCLDVGQFSRTIDIFKDVVDVFHVHNEPNWFVTIIKERTDKPVILDVHDSFLARTTQEEQAELLKTGKNYCRVLTEERNNFQIADGLVFPGEAFSEIVRSEFKLKQPYIVLPSYLPHRMQGYNNKEWLGGLVYEGRIDLKEEIDKAPIHHGFRYTDYEDLAQQCHDKKIDFHIYARNDKKFLEIYEKIAFTHVPQNYEALIDCLSRHDWGLVGNSFKTQEWEIAFPNKLFEYLAASVPVVAWNAGESAKFLEEHDIGMRIESLDDLIANWKKHEYFRNNLIKKRKEFFMENHIERLLGLYAEVIG